MLQLHGDIVLISEDTQITMEIVIEEKNTGKMLALLDALKCESIKAFAIYNKTDRIVFCRDKATAYIEVNSQVFALDERQFELLRYSCIDSILMLNPDPWVHHIDLQCGTLDFTFRISMAK